MSKIIFLGGMRGKASGVDAPALPRPKIRPRLKARLRPHPEYRPYTRFGRGEMTTPEKVKAILAGIIIGLMLAAPVAALVAVAGNRDPTAFHDLSPWSFGVDR